MSDDLIESQFPQTGPRVEGGRPGAWKIEARELLRLGIPLAITQVAQMIVLATDTLMLGHFRQDALAAAALGNTLYVFCWLVGCGPASAVSPLVAHLRGAGRGDGADAAAVVAMGFWSVLLLCLPLLALLFFTQDILLALGEAPLLAAAAARYMRALMLGLPFALAYLVLRNFSTAMGRTKAPMAVMLGSILFNTGGDYLLIFGHLGAPRLGILGAGISSALCNLFSFLALYAVLAGMPAMRGLGARIARLDAARLRELLRLGIPISITMLFEIMLFTGSTLVMGRFGTAALAAHQIALTIPSLTFMVPLGIGMAATVRVGLAMGAGDRREARLAGFTAFGISAVFMSFTALVLLLFPQAIARAWFANASAETIALTALFLHVAAAFQIADGLQVTASMALRGLKDARAPMWIAGGAYWLVGAPLCLLLGFHFGMKGLGIWLGLAAGLFVAAAALVARFSRLSAKDRAPAPPRSAPAR